jgi:microcin C transport system substrate-binding protein
MKPSPSLLAKSIGVLLLSASAAYSAPSHGIAMFGDLKYPAWFSHFAYTNPNAPKGGAIKLGVVGSYDNLNPFILKGISATGVSDLVFEALLSRSKDEPFSYYGLLAQKVELSSDNKHFRIWLNPEAKFSDGKPVTADDVLYSLDIFKNVAHPIIRSNYADVSGAEKISDREVVFHISNPSNRELPVIIGGMNVLPKHFFANHEFNQTTLTPLIGSGPYVIDKVDPGRSIVYKRNPDYWGMNLAVNRGMHNFEQIIFDYYRDDSIAVQAVKAGQIDLRLENISRNWATAYDIPAVKNGYLKKEGVRHEIPSPMQGFVINLRRQKFQNPKVREALNLAFDFEWANRNLFYSIYRRTRSYFGNSPFEAKGLPTGRELEILEQYRKQIPERVFTEEYNPPATKGSGKDRANLIKAQSLLKEAGWVIEDGRLVDPVTRQPFEIELLIVTPSFERVMANYVKNLRKLGIQGRIKLVDSSQYQKRQESFDYDISIEVIAQSSAPGNELTNFWHSSMADVRGSRNIMGVEDPVIDKLVNKVIRAQDYEELLAATMALDRVLQWNFFLIPNWHSREFRIVYWDKFGRPQIQPKYDLGYIDTWWSDEKRVKRVAEYLRK